MIGTHFCDDPLRVAPPAVIRTAHRDGGFVLRSPEPLGAFDRCTGVWIDRWAGATPSAIAFTERDPRGAWRELDWAGLRRAVGSVGQALLDLDAPIARPVVILSDNAIDHAILMLAAQYVGRPVCTVSSAYSRLARDFGRIRTIVAALGPSLVYAADAAVYGPALAALADRSRPGGALAGAEAGVPVYVGGESPGARPFAELVARSETPAVAAAQATIGPDHVAKYLLTSGSTGVPKVVVNTHRMLCANQQMIAQTWRFLAREKPVVVDWLPWSHTFGGNHNLHLALRHGGTMTIDEGRPAPGLIERSVANLRAVRPTLYFNVPRGFDLLLPFLEADSGFAADFFSRLQMVFYAAAALPQSSWDRLAKVAAAAGRPDLWLTTAWGATETAPAITTAHWRLDRPGVIGLPMPGMELKFVPNAEKLEMRVRGTAVFPGYRDAPELTAAAFDDEGFYRIGDAGRLVDDARPERGVVFDGRVAEDFKLASGTWVSVGMLRVKLIALFDPYVADAVICGHDGDTIGALVFLSPAAAALDREALRTALRGGLERLAAEGGGSSQRVTCVRVTREPAAIDTGEITDKGYLNQRAVLARRASEVRALLAGEPGDEIQATIG